MQKIISLFQRNYDGDRLVRDEVVPGAEWVLEREGIATQKHDGTCCMFRDRKLFKRHTVKRGKKTPKDFEAATEIDEKTGKQEGWVPVGDGPDDVRHREAESHAAGPWEDGTYELCGPKVQGNPEGYGTHFLVLHGVQPLGAPRTFDELKEWLSMNDVEGIVWHHPDGRMVKIKGKDFGLKRSESLISLDDIRRALDKAGVKNTIEANNPSECRIHTTESGTELTVWCNKNDSFRFSDRLVSGPGSPSGAFADFDRTAEGVERFVERLLVDTSLYRSPQFIVRKP